MRNSSERAPVGEAAHSDKLTPPPRGGHADAPARAADAPARAAEKPKRRLTFDQVVYLLVAGPLIVLAMYVVFSLGCGVLVAVLAARLQRLGITPEQPIGNTGIRPFDILVTVSNLLALVAALFAAKPIFMAGWPGTKSTSQRSQQNPIVGNIAPHSPAVDATPGEDVAGDFFEPN